MPADAEVLHAWCGRLGEAGIRHFVTGSVASSAWGEPRFTNDVDMVLDIDAANFHAFLEAASGDYACSESELRAALGSGEPVRSVQVMFEPTALKFDCFVATLPYERAEFDRICPIEVAPGLVVPFASPEYVLIAKCRWYEMGRRVSERQRRDIAGLLSVQGASLNLPYVERRLDELGLRDAWVEVRSGG
ncbi:MAG: hypothetical protein KIS66_05765 [Fimbriimonadaceae bacterium]|nr:hypothetical protein [Fimbriimonadaceae bacterium]